MAAYIERGDIQFTYRYVLNVPDSSMTPALATECANEQGKFWAYQSTVFEHFSAQGYSATNLKRWAQDLGLDTPRFNACFDSQKYKGKIQQVNDEGRKAGVQGTPTFFINSRMVEGLDPNLMRYIDDAVKQAASK